MSRYYAERQEWLDNCEHPDCAVLHKNKDRYRWVGGFTNPWHAITRSEWVVIDSETGERANGFLSDSFATKRDALAAIRSQDGDSIKCRSCLGRGKRSFYTLHLHNCQMDYHENVPCKTCKGTGMLVPSDGLVYRRHKEKWEQTEKYKANLAKGK